MGRPTRTLMIGALVLTGSLRMAQAGDCDVQAIGIMSQSSFALTGGAVPMGWGQNSRGELAFGAAPDRFHPVRLDVPDALTAIAGGDSHVLAIAADGTLWGWGWNSRGQLGRGYDSLVERPEKVPGLVGVSDLSAAGSYSMVRLADGTLWTFGLNTSGQLGLGSGAPFIDQPGQVTLPVSVTSMGAGLSHALVTLSDGTVWAWGNNAGGQLGLGSTGGQRDTPQEVVGLPRGAIDVDGGDLDHSLAVLSDGTIWAWGNNSFGQLGDGTNLNSNIPVQVSGITNAVNVAAGSRHSLALLGDGSVVSWGRGQQLGNGILIDSNVPVPVSNLSFATAIRAGVGHSLALDFSGTLWSWGVAQNGALGLGDDINTLEPRPVSLELPIGDVLNTLLAVKEASGLRLHWYPADNATSHSVYRDSSKEWPAPLLLSDMAGLELSDTPTADRNFYRVTGTNCAGVEGN